MITEKELAGIKRGESIKRYHGGKGLYLIVQKEGSRGKDKWQGRYIENGKERRILIGNYPQLSLADAHIRLSEIKEGVVPGTTQEVSQLNLMELSNLLDLQLDAVDAIAETSKRLDNIEQSIASLFDQLTQLINDSAKPIAQVLPNPIPKPIEQPITKSIPEALSKPIEEPPSLPCHKPPPKIPNMPGSLPAKRKPNHFEPGSEPTW